MSNAQSTKPRSRTPQIAFGGALVVLAFVGVLILGRGGGGGGGGHSVTVLAAAHTISTGSAVTAAEVTTTQVDIPPTGAIIDRTTAVGKIARQDIASGTVLTDAMLAAPAIPGAAKLYFALPPGDVALNIPSSDISPYVQPGDQIDVIASLKPGAPGNASLGTQTNSTLKGLKVISVGTPGTPTAGNLVVAVTLQQADLLEYIVKNTDFTYVLKSPLDATNPDPGTQAVDVQTIRSEFGFR